MQRPPPALVAALIGVAIVPAFVLAAIPGTGERALAAVAVALAAIAAAGVILLRVPAGSLGTALVGPAIGIGVVAHAGAERAIADAAAGPGLVGGIVLAIGFGGLAWAGGALGAALLGVPAARRTAAGAAATMVAIAIGIAALVALRGEAAVAEERLAAIRPQRWLGVLVDDETQRETSVPRLVIERACGESFCELVVSVDHGGTHRVGTRRPLEDRIDRAPLAIVELAERVVVLPGSDGGLDWSRAMAFDRETAQPAGVRARDLGVATGPPMPWRAASAAGLVLALVLVAFRWRAMGLRRLLSGALDAIADEDGVLRLGDGTIARADVAVAPGRCVVLAIDRSAASYRVDGAAVGRGVAEGTVASHTRLQEERIGALDLATIGALAITHAPLAAAWIAGYSVLGG